ncbi:MAG: hypothetical protein Q9Q40_10700, partial [Acidobacteriota bacterium]|nr:hypothetical protein [Acidobacteriota bacterium]
EDAPAFSGATGEGCVINGQNKSPDPAANDLDGLEDGSPILFRIEVEDKVGPEKVALTVLLAWECDSGTCLNQCTWKQEDTAVQSGHPLYGTEDHQQGFLAHHWDIAARAFRAGSKK